MNTMETVKNVAYGNGTRISTVERVVTRADDAEQLGNLYFRLSGVYRQLSLISIMDTKCPLCT